MIEELHAPQVVGDARAAVAVGFAGQVVFKRPGGGRQAATRIVEPVAQHTALRARPVPLVVGDQAAFEGLGHHGVLRPCEAAHGAAGAIGHLDQVAFGAVAVFDQGAGRPARGEVDAQQARPAPATASGV